jgi:hypothetical protein
MLKFENVFSILQMARVVKDPVFKQVLRMSNGRKLADTHIPTLIDEISRFDIVASLPT